MQGGNWEIVPFAVLMALAFAAWCVAGYSMFGVLSNARHGRWFRLLFQFGWWNPRTADQYIDPPGLPHRQRLLKAMIIFFVAVFCALAYGLLQIGLQG